MKYHAAMDDDHDELWQDFTRDIRPIKRDKPLETAETKVVKKKPQDKGGVQETAVFKKMTSKPRKPLQGVDVDRRTAEKLRKGKMAIEGRLDLHGMGREAAHMAVVRFIEQSYQQGKRCILIITGKGNTRGGVGVLKSLAPDWIHDEALRPYVLRTASAIPKDGGEGALYVLLRRKREA